MTRPQRITAAAAALMSGLILLLGACTVSTSSSDRPQSQQDQFERDRAVRYDLSTPPVSAQQLGVKEGMTSGAFNRVDDDSWTYELELPGGTVFTTQGFGHRVIVESGSSRMFSYNSVLINTVSADVEAAATELDKGVTLLGLDADLVRDWTAQARARAAEAGDKQVFAGQRQGYLAVDVTVRREERSERVVLNWNFLWDLQGPDEDTPASEAPGA